MEILDKLKSKLADGSLSPEELQLKLTAYLHEYTNESKANDINNKIELIIFSLKEEDKVEALVNVINEVKKIACSTLVDKSKLTMYEAVEFLLHDLCVNWGFCIPPNDAENIKESENLDADDFACKVLIAEGMDYDYEKEWRSKIRNEFIRHFGFQIAKTDFKNNL